MKKVKISKTIRGKAYIFEITAAYCDVCGCEISIPGMIDYTTKEIDEQYRKTEGIITTEEIVQLTKQPKMNISVLSQISGLGQDTITHYLAGQVPSKEHSVILRQVFRSVLQ